jgi:hypothetical protein
MRETAVIAVAIAVSFWFLDLLAHERSAFSGEHFSVSFAHAWRPAMAALVRFVDAKEKKAEFINPNHIRVVKARSDGWAEIVLDDKISIFAVETPDAVIKALDHG